MKRLYSTIVAILDIKNAKLQEALGTPPEFGSAGTLGLRDAVVAPLPDGSGNWVVSPSDQLKVLIQAGRIEVQDFSLVKPAQSKVPDLLEKFLGKASVGVTTVGLNHDLELAPDEDARQKIATHFMAPWVGKAFQKSGATEVGAALRFLFRDNRGSWQILVTPVVRSNAIRLTSNLERKDLVIKQSTIADAWQDSLDALEGYLKQLKLS